MVSGRFRQRQEIDPTTARGGLTAGKRFVAPTPLSNMSIDNNMEGPVREGFWRPPGSNSVEGIQTSQARAQDRLAAMDELQREEDARIARLLRQNQGFRFTDAEAFERKDRAGNTFDAISNTFTRGQQPINEARELGIETFRTTPIGFTGAEGIQLKGSRVCRKRRWYIHWPDRNSSHPFWPYWWRHRNVKQK
jgi:hypothetical protein